MKMQKVFRRGIFLAFLAVCGVGAARGEAFWDFETSYKASVPSEAVKAVGGEEEKVIDSFVFSEGSGVLDAGAGFDSWCWSIFGPFSLSKFNSFEPSGILLIVR